MLSGSRKTLEFRADGQSITFVLPVIEDYEVIELKNPEPHELSACPLLLDPMNSPPAPIAVNLKESEKGFKGMISKGKRIIMLRFS